MPDALYIIYLFIIGACVGSFLNVVVWRLPRNESLISPPSHCPKCGHKLAWFDNIPVFGWIFLRGRCRYCKNPISSRYPIIEALMGSLLVFYYVMYFMLHIGPCSPGGKPAIDPIDGHLIPATVSISNIARDWPIYALHMGMIATLLAISLIDAELWIVLPEMTWLLAGAGIIVHALIDTPSTPGAILLLPAHAAAPGGVPGVGELRPSMSAALAAGGGAGLLISLLLLAFKVVKRSFPDGEPAVELDMDLWREDAEKAKAAGEPEPPKPRIYTRAEIRDEMRKEMLFLLPPLILGFGFMVLTQTVGFFSQLWLHALDAQWVSGALGAILGALVGGLIVWLARIFGTLAFGRVAMGLGDVHLMFGVGAIVGAGAVTISFFLAPFGALVIGLWAFFTRKRHELPLGPYLSLGTAVVLLCYCPIADYFTPGMQGVAQALGRLLSGG